MNKLKVAIQALRDHLGRDSRGIQLLDDVTTIANDQRKRIASLETANAELAEHTGTLRIELDKATEEIRLLKQGIHKEQSQSMAALAKVSLLSKEVESMTLELYGPPDEETTDTIEIKTYRRLLKEVRRRFKKMPAGRYAKSVIELQDACPSYSHAELTGLGMLVALCALVGLPCGVASRIKLKDIEGYDFKHDLGPFLRMYRNWIQKPNNFEEKCYRAGDRAAIAAGVRK